MEREWERPAYLVQDGDDWREVSWREAAESVDELAHGLLALGVRKGDAFAILASTRLEWALFDFALGLVGAVGAGIYANSSQRDVAHVLTHSQAVGVLCVHRPGCEECIRRRAIIFQVVMNVAEIVIEMPLVRIVADAVLNEFDCLLRNARANRRFRR